MQIKNKQLVAVGNYLASLTLPANVSRARTKLIATINSRLQDYNNERQKLIAAHHGVNDDTTNLVTFPSVEENNKAVSEMNELDNETAIIQPLYAEQFEILKKYFASYDGEVVPEQAEAFDALYDALDINEDEQN